MGCYSRREPGTEVARKTSGMSDDNGSDLDEDLDAQLARLREMLKLMAPEAGSASALGAAGNNASTQKPRADPARDRSDAR